MAPIHSALSELSCEGQNKPNSDCQIKTNISSAVQGVLPVMTLHEAVANTLKVGENGELETRGVSQSEASTFIEFLEDLLSEIYLFSETPDIMTVILDTLNYESDYLTTRLEKTIFNNDFYAFMSMIFNYYFNYLVPINRRSESLHPRLSKFKRS